MKNILEGINNRLHKTQDYISDLEDKVVENTQSQQQKEKRIKKTEESLRDLWDNINCTNTHILGVPEAEEREQSIENIFEEIMLENFPNLVKQIEIQD